MKIVGCDLHARQQTIAMMDMDDIFALSPSSSLMTSALERSQAGAERNGKKARVAVARKLGIRLWIMLRDQIDEYSLC